MSKAPQLVSAESTEKAKNVSAIDQKETERRVKVIMAMGYPEGLARSRLSEAGNNVERAVNLLLEEHTDEHGLRRKRRCIKELRNGLLGDPFALHKNIERMMQDRRCAQTLTEMVNGRSLEIMQGLLDLSSSSDDEDEDQQESSSPSSG
ncbi:uncharacterized protein LOC117581654 [Drosophila guanche]|uniref:UBA domain-containing protein n=1 Tax=Drosophila guanche TaxID=7266 RepID=A0A3B0J7V6_DROGU|nr:uncharacterized protein LOC117581654 [Drosophila guanche]SPP77915.1 Hypothetical predicted protein [Drosophila guanche]